MNISARLTRIEKARRAKDAVLKALVEGMTTEELECISRDTGAEIRTGKLAGHELVQFAAMAKLTPGTYDGWLAQIEQPRSGDAEMLQKIMFKVNNGGGQ